MTNGIIALSDESMWDLYAIPSELKKLDRFIVWRVGGAKVSGKFSKIPLDPRTNQAADAKDPAIRLTFTDAVHLYESGKCDGIGIALGREGVQDAHGRYLTCIDLDGLPPEQAETIYKRLGKPWAERSPSGNGYHFWMWSREFLTSGKAENGRELYQRNQFITVTGWESEAIESLPDATEELSALHAEWFGHTEHRTYEGGINGAARGADALTLQLAESPPPPETPEEIARVRGMLAAIGADGPRDKWRNTVWAVLSTGWNCAEQLARDWSESCPEKFDETDFEGVIRSYEPGRIGFGTLVHFARHAGWAPTAGPTAAAAAVSAQAWGDIRNARAFADLWRGKLVFVTSRKAWLRWGDRGWQLCQRGEEMAAARTVCAKLVTEATAELAVSHSAGKQLMQHAIASHTLGRLEAMVKLAQSEGGMSVTEPELDADPRLLGVANGVVDLRTGQLRPNSPDDYITRYCAASYDSAAQCPRWLQFLDEVFLGDAETIEAVQTLLGYTLTGLNTEEIMVVAYGYGANGKSVFGNVVHSIMGGYSTMAASSLLVARVANDTGPRDDLAALAGARHVSINELQSGDKLDERVVKVLAGREPISARHLYGSHFTYQPTFTAWLRTNHKPIIQGTDEGIWRRLVLLPFKRQFAPHERDPGLEARLHAERDGILAWMVAGAVRYLREGLKRSPCMKAELTAYRKESDLLGEFLADTTRPAPNERVDQSHLFGAWQAWCQTNGIQHGAKASFTRRLTERGFSDARSNGRRYYTGLTMAF